MGNHPTMSDVNIMLLGSTGAGKSASGNTIIGGVKKTFKEDFSPASVTKFCESAQTEDQTITVIDTVGLSDTSVKITDAQTEIQRMLQITNLDVFLLVIKLGETFTEEKRKVVHWIQDNFGAKALKHTIVLFTHRDKLHVSIEEYLSKSKALRSVADQCSGGYHVFNNKDKARSQVTELLEKIKKLREKNGSSKYTEQDYAKAQDQLLLKKCKAGAKGGAVIGAAVGVGAGAVVGAAKGVIALMGFGLVGGLVGLAAFGAIEYISTQKYTAINKNVEKKNKSV